MRSLCSVSAPIGLLSLMLGNSPTAIAQAATTVGMFMPTAAPLMASAGCPGNRFHCPASLGQAFSNVCCENGQSCALDESQQPACCPSGLVCTGNAPSDAPTAEPTTAVSYISNPYFSFPYAGTKFENGKQCTSAVSACSSNYDACVTNLGGGGNNPGVTIVVPGAGGTTIGGGGSDLGASATKVCSSLRSEACSDLDVTQCAEFSSGKDHSAASQLSSVAGGRLLLGAAAVAVLLSGFA